MKNKGFTLIELLVVILIIGILAAIAVPKYQVAVDKSAFSKCQAMVVSLIKAYREYVLINGHGTKNFEDLSFSMPSNFTKTADSYVYSCMSSKDMMCCITTFQSGQNPTSIYCLTNDNLFGYSEEILDENNNEVDTKECVARYGNNRAQRLCKTLGTGSRVRSLYLKTHYQDGWVDSYVRYKL